MRQSSIAQVPRYPVSLGFRMRWHGGPEGYTDGSDEVVVNNLNLSPEEKVYNSHEHTEMATLT